MLCYNLSPADMAEAAFYMCAYEFAIKTVNSPWCCLYDEVDAQVRLVNGKVLLVHLKRCGGLQKCHNMKNCFKLTLFD